MAAGDLQAPRPSTRTWRPAAFPCLSGGGRPVRPDTERQVMADNDDVKAGRLASWLDEIANGLDRSHDVAKTASGFGPFFGARQDTVDSAVGCLLDLGFPIDAQRLKRTFAKLSRQWFAECATDYVEEHPEDAASWVEKFGTFPAPPQSPTERQAQQDRRLILGQGAKGLAEFVRALRRDACQPADPLTQVTPAGVAGGGNRSRKGTGGRTPLSKREAKRRAQIIERWQRAKGVGIRLREFCRDEGLTAKELTTFVAWDSQRTRRKRTN